MLPSKQELRGRIRQQKAAMTAEDRHHRSLRLCQMVLQSQAYRSAKSVYGYLPFNQEVNTLPLLQQAMADGKTVALPKCRGKDMRFVTVTDLSAVKPGAIGAPEPIADEPIATDETALVILPGLAFDSFGHRLGYGGGFYDRFLAKEPHPTIALCFDFQMLPQLETEPHDISADTVYWI